MLQEEGMTNQQLADKLSQVIMMYMEHHGIGITELERRSGVVRQTIAQYVNGDVMKICPRSVFQLLDFFDLELVIKRKDRIVG